MKKRAFGIEHDDAVEIQQSLIAGLQAQNELYDMIKHDISSMEKKSMKFQSRRAIKKIAYINGFTKLKSKDEIKALSGLVIR